MNASRDQNLVTTLLGVSSADGTTPVTLYADPTTHRLLTQSSGGGAPSDATFVTLSTNATLTNERVLTGTANQVTITDNGAGSTVVLSLPQSIATSSTPTFASMTLTAASSLTLGTASTNTGAIILKNSTNANNTVLQAGAAAAALTFTLPTTDGNSGEVLTTDGNGVLSWAAAGGSGTVTSVSVVTANGFAGSVANATTTPAITLTLSGTSATTQVLFNEGGSAIGGDAEFAWDTATKKLSLGDVDTMTVNGSTVTTRLAAHSFDAATAAAIEMHNHTDTAGRGPTAYYARSRGTAGTPTVVQSGDSLGELNAVGFDGTDYATSAGIVFEVDGTPGNNDMPGRIIFKTSPDGSQTLAEVLRLAADKTATFAGTVVMPTPFTLGATSVTTTGTQLNYLNAATGTTGTTSTNLVFSTSPTLVTPVLGAATATSINGLTITSSTGTLTITNAKTLSVSNTLTLAGTDGTTMTFPTTTATIARTDAAQTFTGVQSMTSPDITTSLTTPSTTFSLVNATATTVNFAGAATTLNMAGGSGAVINLGGGANAAELRFLEPSGSGTNYTAFKAQAQGANITYTLPATVGAAGTFLTDAAGNGTLSWAAASASTTNSRISNDWITARAGTGVNGGGTATFNTAGVDLNTSATGTSSAKATFAMSNGAMTWAAVAWTGGLQFSITTAPTSNNPEALLGFGRLTIDGTSITRTTSHVGVYLKRESGANNLYFSQGDGATGQLSSLITTFASGDFFEVFFEGTPSTNCKFYYRKNGGSLSSATTLSTNNPSTSSTDSVHFAGVTNAATADTFRISANCSWFSR